jgi:hypothetical protein
MNLSIISSDCRVNSQYDSTKFNFLDSHSAQYDRLTYKKTSNTNVDLNMASGWDMKPVVDILVKSRLSTCNWDLPPSTSTSKIIWWFFLVGLREKYGCGQACGQIHIPNDMDPVSRSEPAAPYTAILTPIQWKPSHPIHKYSMLVYKCDR